MNPADAMQVAPVADMSLLGLFLQAHFVVKIVMLGLLGASILVLVDHRRQDPAVPPRPQGNGRVRGRILVGPLLEELFRSFNDRPATGLAAVFVAAMREWKRSFEGSGRQVQSLSQRIEKQLDVTIQREVERLESRLLFLASIGSAARIYRPVRYGVGHHDRLHLDRGLEEHLARRRGAGHRGGPVRHRHRPVRGDPGGARLQQAPGEVAKAQSRLEGFADEFSAILSRQIDERLSLAA